MLFRSGVNAAVVSSLAIAQLQKSGWHGQIRRGRQRGTSNLGVVRGGAATNVVMPLVQLEAEARSHDSEFRAQIVAAWRAAFEAASSAVSNAAGVTGVLRFSEEVRYEPFRMPADSACVESAAAAVRTVGLKPATQICDGGLDANWMAEHGFPAVTLGCGQHDIHTVRERLSISEYLQGCRVATLLASG